MNKAVHLFSDLSHVIPGHVPDATEDITDYLLDRVLPVAYAHRLGQPPPSYGLGTAQNTLTKIAARMNRDGIRDLQWWRIPEWVPSAQRFVGSGLVFGLVGGLVSGFVGRFDAGFAVTVGLACGVLSGFSSLIGNPPGKTARLRLRKALNRGNLELGLLGGLAVGLAFGLLEGLRTGLAVGLLTGLASALTTPVVLVSLTAVQIAIKWHTPVHLMRFLMTPVTETSCAP